MTDTITIPPIAEAKRIERRDTRSVKFEWDLGEIAPEYDGGRPRRALAVLTIRHRKAGANIFSGEITTEDYFDVSIARETEEETETFKVRGFTMFNGLGLLRIPAGNRYSQKKLRDAEPVAIATFERLRDEGNERLAIYFDLDHDPKMGR